MKCDKCGSENLQFLETYGKKISILVILPIAIIEAILLFYGIIKLDFNLIIVIAFLIPIEGIFFRLYNYQQTRKSKTKYICKDCGHSELLKK